MRIGKVKPSGRRVICTLLKLGPDLTGPSGLTFPILTMTPVKDSFYLGHIFQSVEDKVSCVIHVTRSVSSIFERIVAHSDQTKILITDSRGSGLDRYNEIVCISMSQ